MRFYKPESPEEAAALLGEDPGLTPIAGGTDLVVAMRAGKVQPRAFLDLTAAGLDQVEVVRDGVRIGATLSMTRLANLEEVFPELRVVCDAARQVGAWQIQSRATIGGNICNASPAADVACALLAMDAEVELLSPSGSRRLPLSEFLQGPGRTARREDEVLSNVLLPRREPEGLIAAGYRKVGPRSAMYIAVASLGAWLELEPEGRIRDVHLACGSVAPTVLRLEETERLLRGEYLSDDLVLEAVETAKKEVSPIDDVRASRDYRLEVVGALVAERLSGALELAGHGRQP